MKRKILTLLVMCLATASFAVPAKRGVWKTLKLSDGTEVRAQLCGDEHLHFWRTEDGATYVRDSESETYVLRDHTAMVRKIISRNFNISKARRQKLNTARRKKGYFGKKMGIVILVQFTDQSFVASNNQATYNNLLNTEGYSKGSFKGSVHDYFKDQSGGLFDLEFDVVGPVSLKRKSSYYGKNDSDGNDMYPGTMVAEACKAVNDSVDFSRYDWTGNGYVDQVYVVYAGKGEANGGSEDTIWPHEYTLLEGDYGRVLTLDGVKINTYACGCELDGSGKLEGIGTFCHEFSHCLGFPDFYDTQYDGHFGMGDFDLLCSGSYNGDGFVPAGYTSYEKWEAGWLEPIVLSDENMSIDSLKALSEGGDAYIIYNEAHPDEYYLIENRQKKGWDAKIPAKGLMITHVDYDENAWLFNIVNTVVDLTEYAIYYPEYAKAKNDHERMTIFHADNDDDRKYWRSEGYYTKTTEQYDLYPYRMNDSLTNYSKPAAKLYNKNTDGSKLMGKSILNIKQNSGGTMSFRFLANKKEDDTGVESIADGDYAASPYYDLSGRPVATLRKGLYITNGRKFIVK